MKRLEKCFLIIIGTLAGCSQFGFAQPALTVTPSITSNTYSGVITLNITGLNSGEAVTIQRWLDSNGNGLIDPGEPLVDTFKLTDNNKNNALIGGVTNLNVPFDLNSSAGAITAGLNFPSDLISENMVGNSVYQLVSPTSRFLPVTATFAVTNSALGLSVSGIVYSNGVAPFPYAMVVAQDPRKNSSIGATVADGNGHYLLTLPSSSYNLMAAMPNYYQDLAQTPAVILTNGAGVTTDLYLTNGTAMMSGKVYDSVSKSGLGGLVLTLQSGHLFALAFTDTNGNYSAAVTPEFWTVRPNMQRLARRAYLLPSTIAQADVTSGSATNADVALSKSTALFYGRITNNSNQPFANVVLTATAGYDCEAKGYSDANGNYAVAVLGDKTNLWYCEANSGINTSLSNYVVNLYNWLTLTSNQTVLQNFTALPGIQRITGHVHDSYGNSVAGVGVNAYANVGNGEYESLTRTTDDSGNYSFVVAAGGWTPWLIRGNSSDSLDTHGLTILQPPPIEFVPPGNVPLEILVFPLAKPSIAQAKRTSPAQFGFSITGATNVSYSVQVSTDPASTNWSPLFSLTLTNSPFPVVDRNATDSQRFYRVKKN
ncbi:MAG: hypothetical protein JWR26_1035 [Pedosphaera sp.]|nr:hypothetical protein [Pedosphaera sp.]